MLKHRGSYGRYAVLTLCLARRHPGGCSALPRTFSAKLFSTASKSCS